MPMGCSSLVPYVVSLLEKQDPLHCILDLGIGMGFYGTAIRQWIDKGKHPFGTWVVGVEGFPEYRNPAWNLYNQIHVQTIQAYLDNWELSGEKPWDAILLMDVLEHFPKDDGRILLRRIRNQLGGDTAKLIVGTPAVWMEQGAAYGNALEVHHCWWTAEELAGEGFTIIQQGTEPNEFGHRMVLGWSPRL